MPRHNSNKTILQKEERRKKPLPSISSRTLLFCESAIPEDRSLFPRADAIFTTPDAKSMSNFFKKGSKRISENGILVLHY